MIVLAKDNSKVIWIKLKGRASHSFKFKAQKFLMVPFMAGIRLYSAKKNSKQISVLKLLNSIDSTRSPSPQVPIHLVHCCALSLSLLFGAETDAQLR